MLTLFSPKSTVSLVHLNISGFLGSGKQSCYLWLFSETIIIFQLQNTLNSVKINFTGTVNVNWGNNFIPNMKIWNCAVKTDKALWIKLYIMFIQIGKIWRNLNLFCHQEYDVKNFQMVLNGTAKAEWTTGIQSVAMSGVFPDATTSRPNLGPIQSSTEMELWSLSQM